MYETIDEKRETLPKKLIYTKQKQQTLVQPYCKMNNCKLCECTNRTEVLVGPVQPHWLCTDWLKAATKILVVISYIGPSSTSLPARPN